MNTHETGNNHGDSDDFLDAPPVALAGREVSPTVDEKSAATPKVAKVRRGPKPRPKALPRESLSPDPPKELALNAAAAKAYTSIADRLIAEGYACQADARVIASAAVCTVLVDRLRKDVNKLKSLTVPGTQGNVRPHPLLRELRSEEVRLEGLLGALLLTPRSRSASRLTESQVRDAKAKGQDADPESIGNFLARG